MQSVVIGRVIGWLCAWSVMASFTCAQDAAPPAGPIEIEAIALDRPVDFTIDVLPILKQSCIACHHGPDAESALVLEDAAAILAGGDSGPAVDLKNPAGSLLLRVAAKLEKPFMPPRNNKVGAPPLTPQQLGMLKLWIEQGAKGPSRKFPPPTAVAGAAARLARELRRRVE
jgi:hypothetical protein